MDPGISGISGETPADVARRSGVTVWWDVAAASLVATVIAMVASRWFDLGATYIAKVAAAWVFFVAVGSFMSRNVAAVSRFNTADRITLARAALVMLVAAMIGETLTPGLAGLTLGVAAAAALLDAVDGAVARRKGQATAFGARFDMEVDALLILALSVLAWSWGKAGSWILLAGLARYLFVACAAVMPFMNRPLPPSRRRQAACVVQVVTLLVCIAPWIVSPVSDLVACAGLLVLIHSFSVDVHWLHRDARTHSQPGRSL